MGPRTGIALLFFILVTASGATPPEASTAGRPESAARLAILPVADHATAPRHVLAITAGLHERLDDAGIPYVSARQLRPLLRRHRIRSIGRVGRADAAVIGQATGVEYLLLGSLDVADSATAEVAVSLRLYGLREQRVVRAASVAAAGEDFTGPFGVGRLTRIDEVSERVVSRAFEALGEPLPPTAPAPAPDAPRVAIVPFDSMADLPDSGRIVGNILLSELLDGGYVSAEPGAVHELLLQRQTMARGGIDLATLAALHDDLDVDLVITGTVDRLEPARGGLAVAAPAFALGARLLDAGSGRLIAAWEMTGEGDDTETLLGIGRTHSLGRLLQHAARDLVDRVDDALEDRQQRTADH